MPKQFLLKNLIWQYREESDGMVRCCEVATAYAYLKLLANKKICVIKRIESAVKKNYYGVFYSADKGRVAGIIRQVSLVDPNRLMRSEIDYL